MPLAHFRQDLGNHDDKEKEPPGHAMQLDIDNAPTALEYVPEEQGAQAFVPLTYAPAAHAVEQEEDPAAEYIPALHARHVAILVAPAALEEVPAAQGVQTLLAR